MKKIYFVIIAFLAFSTFLFSQTSGELTVTVTTSSTGGNFAPRNIVSIWIEDVDGNFVKTLLAYAQTRKTHLNMWQATTTAAGSAYNTVDAITGPTKTSHGTRTCYWDGTDVDGVIVTDGSYKLWMELTDKNATGNYSFFTIVKGEESQIITPINMPSFGSITINWEPTISEIDNFDEAESYRVFPNPTTNKLNIEGKNIVSIEIIDAAGNIIYKGKSKSIDLSENPAGSYLINIVTKTRIVTKKIIKQ